MRYFEFNKSAYYALLGAETQEDAEVFYEEVVADAEEGDGPPDELQEDEAREKLSKACEDDYLTMAEFDSDALGSEAFVVLVDKELL